MIRKFGAAIVFAICWQTSAYALDQLALQQLQQTNACEGCDLSGAELPGWRLTSLDLAGANLNGADLTRSVITNVDLSNANLRDAYFSGALIQQTWLRGADLTGTSFAGAVFVGTDLSGATGLAQFQLDQACDDQRANVSQVPIPFTLPVCQ